MHEAGSLSHTGKSQRKNSGVDGPLTSCGDAQKESENKAFIQVFHPIQSVKSTNAVMLRHTHIRQDQHVIVGVAEHRQATHEHMSNVDINGQARSQTQAHELSGSLTPCEDAQNRRRHPDRSRTKKIVSVSQTVLSTAKSLSTCNYTSNNGRSIQGLEILPAAHAYTHTHKHTVRKLTPLCDGLTAHLVVSDVPGSTAICGRCTWHAKHQLVSGSLHTWPL